MVDIKTDSISTVIGLIQREMTIAGKGTITMAMSEDMMIDTMNIHTRIIDILITKTMVILIIEIMIGVTIGISYAMIA